MSDIVYAVHTHTCTYLLDEDGVCRWIISPTGMLPADVRQCVNAQFVACIDVFVVGGLVGELRVGASALFASAGEDGRMTLLRTAKIDHVELRGGEAPGPEPMRAGRQQALSQPTPGADERPPVEATQTADSIEIDVEDLIEVGEATVTLTMPLFRRRDTPPPPPPARGEKARRRR